MSNNIDLYLQELETAKVNIKDAIIAKGVTPDGGLSSYGVAIDNIEQGVSGDELQEMIQNAMDEGYQDGYAEGVDDGILEQKSLLESITITDNGTYTKEDGYNEVIVEVPMPTFTTETLDVTLSENGTYNYTPTTDGYSSVDVTVDIVPEPVITFPLDVTLTENGTYNYDPSDYGDGYSSVKVTVEVADSGGDGRLVVPFEEIGYPTELKNELNDELNTKPLSDLAYSKTIYDAWNPSTTNAQNKYNSDRKLVYCPLIDTSKVVFMSYMFQECTSLTTVPLLDTSSANLMSGMFYNCTSLTTIPLLDTSKVTNIGYMFYGCTSLTTVPLLDTSSATNVSNLFGGCASLTTVPLLDTSNVTNMSSMFSRCTSLTTVPLLDTSSATNMSSMFENCTSLNSLPLLDTSNVTNFSTIFGYSDLTKLTDIGGFKNLGMQTNLTGTNGNYALNRASNMTYESIMNIINNLYDRAAAGMSVLTLKLASQTLALLSDDDIVIATNKGWTIS